MDGPQRVAPAEQVRLTEIGRRTEAVIREAGLSVLTEADLYEGREVGGAEIEVDISEGPCGVYVDWVAAQAWREEAYRLAVAGDTKNPRVLQLHQVNAAMRKALTAVLTAAGLTVEPSTDDLRPLQLMVNS